MGIKDWSNKQLRKLDLCSAIEETHFQYRMIQAFKITLQMNTSNEDAFRNFEAEYPSFIDNIMLGLRESQVQLWGFKGNVSEWSGSQKMILSGRVEWKENDDRKERKVLARVYIEPFEERLENLLSEFKAGVRTAKETCAVILSLMDNFQNSCEYNITRLEEEASKDNLVQQKFIKKLKDKAEERIGSIMRQAS